MSNNRHPSSNHRRRLEIELLENRDCPTVTFGFEAGILRVTGDDGPNRIEIVQPRDRVVEVVGDGERRTFEGVDEIRVDAKGGNDEAHSSKPKEIVVVGSKIKINAGPGNDLITIDDGGPTDTPTLHNTKYAVEVDLGTGSDVLNFMLHHHDDINLNLRAADGNDQVMVGMLLPAIQKVRAAAGRASLNLPGGGNSIAVRAENIDSLTLSLIAPAASTVGNVVTVNAHADDHPDFLWLPTNLNSSIQLGAGNDQLTYDFQGIDKVTNFINAGAGNDVIKTTGNPRTLQARTYYFGVVQLGTGNDTFMLQTQGYSEIRNSVNTGPAGNGLDTVVVSHLSLSQTTPIHQRRLTLDSGKDSVDLFAVGYQLLLKKQPVTIEYLLIG